MHGQTKHISKRFLFDAYGTLLDLTAPTKEVFGKENSDLVLVFAETWRTRQLEFAWVDMLLGQEPNFWGVTERALDAALRSFGWKKKTSMREALLAVYRQARAFDDAIPMLERLRLRGAQLAIFSNATADMLRNANKGAGLDFKDEELISVDPSGVFKPNQAAYRYVIKKLSLNPDETCFVSSNAWDAAGAAKAGLQSVWVNRAGADFPYPQIELTRTIQSLSELAGESAIL